MAESAIEDRPDEARGRVEAMRESKDLARARDHLAKAEACMMQAEGLHHLQEGLVLLEGVIQDPAAGASAAIARNLGSTYAVKLYHRINGRLGARRDLPEPELKHLFAVLRAFDEASFETPPVARALKIELVKRLIDRYYEGYSPAEKRKALEELASLSSRGQQDELG
jgi:hypothetical protein